MPITYKDLMNQIFKMTPEQQNQHVTVYVRGVDEYYPIAGDAQFADESVDTLDKGHPFLTV